MRPSFCKKKIRELFQETAFLALGAFLCIYIFQAARLEVDRSMPAYNYIFTALFMPTSFINLVSGFLFKPMLTTLTMTYHQKKLRRFSVWMLGLLGGVALLTLVCLAGAWLLGIPVLSAIYAVDLTDYTQDLLWLILGGGLNAGGILLYYGLTVMRRQKAIFGVYVIVALTALGLPRLLMRFKGFLGASLSYTALMFLQVILFGIVLLWELKKAAGKAGEKANDE